jgi:hypothetical protein
MARLAFRFAIASPRVTADAIEAQSFPDLARKYRVRAVPHSVVNETETLVGAVPEGHLVEAVKKVTAPG